MEIYQEITLKRETEMAFIVSEIINENTIRVTPTWNWGGNTGNEVQINGFGISLSSPANERAFWESLLKQRLSGLILNQAVVLTNPVQLLEPNKKIKCTVLLNSIDIATYFPEYRR